MNLREAAQQVLDHAKWINNEQVIVPYEQMVKLRFMLADEVQDDPVAWPVAWIKRDGGVDDWGAVEIGDTPLYLAPPKREPLTSAEIQECVAEVDDARLAGPITALIRAVERKLGIGGEE